MKFTIKSVIKKRRKKLKKLMIFVPVLILSTLILSVTGLRAWYVVSLRPAQSESSPTKIVIENGASEEEIAKLLKDKDLIRNEFAFKTYVKNSKYSGILKAGSYELDGILSTQEIVAMLGGGKEASVLFTIPPGLRLDQIKAKFIKAGYTEAEASEALNAASFQNHPALSGKPKNVNLEGYLYPESFKITAETPARDIVRQSLDQMAKKLTSDRINAFNKQGLNIHQAIILASLIEEELSIKEDKRIVAQIFLKRLREGISLGSDVTYIYAAAVFGGVASPELDNPYNTRRFTGLPPGPIANVQESSLDAVAYPADTNYLFFISGDDGKTYFANDLQGHEDNIRRYCQKICGK
jgi:UPF0755 protein